MRDTYIIGVSSTPFGKHTDSTISELATTAVRGAVRDAGIAGGLIESVWFGNCFMHAVGQGNVRGHIALTSLFDDGLLEQRTPITNVEAACATGSMAFKGAVTDVRAHNVEVALAVGAEKMHLPVEDDPDRQRVFELLAGCSDRLNRSRFVGRYTEAARDLGDSLDLTQRSSMFMSTYAIQARHHMRAYGIQPHHIAAAAAKTHNYGALNPLAQYQFTLTPSEVLSDRPIVEPFTRAMCSPVSDGAAAAVVCSGDWLDRQDSATQERAVRIRGIGESSGSYQRTPLMPTLSRAAAQRAYKQADLLPEHIDLAEVHDATSYGEIMQAEMLGLCGEGEGGKLAESGETGPGGTIPINTSGGLVAKGHPVGATGLSMLYELTTQLRHEAADRQVPNARFAIAENGGGVVGLEEAACVVTILEGFQK